MPQSLAKIAVHMVFSTKERRPMLRDESLRTDLFAMMAGVLKDDVDSPAIILNGVEDHIHGLFLLSRKFALMKVLQEVKALSSKWLKQQSRRMRSFAWQAGYGAFSVSESNIPEVKRYIENQKEHHRRMTFQEEFRELCRKHGVELDERYAWA